MGLDTRIPLMVQPVQLPDFNALAQQRLQNTTNIMALKKQQTDLQEQQQMRQLYSSSVGPDGKIDQEKLVTGLGQMGRGDLIPHVQAEFADMEAKATQAKKASFEYTLSKLDQAHKDITAAESLDDLKPILQRHIQDKDISVDEATSIWSQASAHGDDFATWRSGFTRHLLDAKDQVSAQQKDDELAARAKQDAAQNQLTMRGQNMTAGTAAARLNFDRQKEAYDRAHPDMEMKIDENSGKAFAFNKKTGAVTPLSGFQGAPKPLTEVQGKAVTFGARMKDADRQLAALDKKGISNTGIVKNTVGSVVNLVPLGIGEKLNAMTDAAFNTAPGILGGPNSEQQSLDQAQRNFLNAILRRESGAAISASEFDNGRRQYFRQPGDADAVVAQKQRNRQIAIAGIRREAGPGASDIDRISAPPPASRKAPPKARGGIDHSNPLLGGG